VAPADGASNLLAVKSLEIKGIRCFAGLASCAVLAVGCGGSQGGSSEVTLTKASQPALPAAAKPPAAVKPGVFFVAGEQFSQVPRAGLNRAADLKSLIQSLISGPTAAERSRDLWSDIPTSTTLTEAAVDETSATANIAVDSSFESGAGATSSERESSLYERLGQVVFTATSLPGVRRVALHVAGSPIKFLERGDFTRPAAASAEAKSAATAAASSLAGSSGQSTASATTTATVSTAKPVVPIAKTQTQLIGLGYLPADAATGSNDYRTQQAVLAFQGWEGLARDGVAGPNTNSRLAAASRPAPSGSGQGRRIEIHRFKGVVLLIDSGRVIRAIHTSTGAGGDSPDTGTPPGSFRIYRKEIRSWSVPFKTWLPYAAYWDRGWALHEYSDVPSRPASHGCARLPKPEAKAVYDFAPIGTPVTVY
jgi:lipoprotein-anchoring transpeptidase ErfK/SrfK